MKKNYLSAVTLISLLLMGMSLNVFAAPSVVVSGNIISISGTVNADKAGKELTAHVTKSAQAIEKINSSLTQGATEIDGVSLEAYMKDNVLYANQVKVAADGSYELHIFMNSSTPEGIYTLTVAGEALGGEADIIPVEYKGTLKFIESIKLLNQAKTTAEVESFIRDYADYYGFDITEYNKNTLVKQAVWAKLLNETYNESISNFSGTVVKLKKDYDDAILLAVLNHEPSASDLLSFISRNISALGLGNDALEGLSTEAKTALGESLINTDFSDFSDFRVKFAKLKLLSLINSSESWGNLADLTEKNTAMLELSIDSISQYDEKRSGAYKNLYTIAMNDGFDSLSDYVTTLKTIFNSYTLPQENTSPNTGRPSGCGSSGSISVPPSAAQVINNPPITENPNDGGNTSVFEDIQGHWAQSIIETLAQRGIMNGKDRKTFAPDDTITRAELAAVLFRAIQPEKKESQLSFSDVNQESDWYAEAIYALAGNGIIAGSNGEFRPNQNISREEMAKMIVLAYETTKATSVEASGDSLADSGKISDWAKEYVSKCVNLGFINGIPSEGGNVFMPQKNATRGEAAKVILAFCDRLEK